MKLQLEVKQLSPLKFKVINPECLGDISPYDAINLAMEACGGCRELSREKNVSIQAVYLWRNQKLPRDQARYLGRMSGIPMKLLLR